MTGFLNSRQDHRSTLLAPENLFIPRFFDLQFEVPFSLFLSNHSLDLAKVISIPTLLVIFWRYQGSSLPWQWSFKFIEKFQFACRTISFQVCYRSRLSLSAVCTRHTSWLVLNWLICPWYSNTLVFLRRNLYLFSAFHPRGHHDFQHFTPFDFQVTSWIFGTFIWFFQDMKVQKYAWVSRWPTISTLSTGLPCLPWPWTISPYPQNIDHLFGQVFEFFWLPVFQIWYCHLLLLSLQCALVAHLSQISHYFWQKPLKIFGKLGAFLSYVQCDSAKDGRFFAL